MNPQVMFYILPESAPQASGELTITSEQAVWRQACIEAAKCYRNNQRVFIYTPNQEAAHQIDELLWSFDPDSFIPHNLVGEGPKSGAAVEISWQAPTSRRPVLINLTDQVPNFGSNYSQIIDFVPSDEAKKQLARERFKTCRQYGLQVETQQVTLPSTQTATINENTSATPSS